MSMVTKHLRKIMELLKICASHMGLSLLQISKRLGMRKEICILELVVCYEAINFQQVPKQHLEILFCRNMTVYNHERVNSKKLCNNKLSNTKSHQEL